MRSEAAFTAGGLSESYAKLTSMSSTDSRGNAAGVIRGAGGSAGASSVQVGGHLVEGMLVGAHCHEAEIALLDRGQQPVSGHGDEGELAQPRRCR